MKEIRKLDMQFRAEPNDEGKMEIKGYAAVFNSPERNSLLDFSFLFFMFSLAIFSI